MSIRELFCTDPPAGFALRAEATFSLGELVCDNRSIFYRACAKFVTQAKLIVRYVVKWR